MEHDVIGPSQRDIDELNKKYWRMYHQQEIILNALFGFLIFMVIFGIGFTCGYYFR
jgi:hypothetical protein